MISAAKAKIIADEKNTNILVHNFIEEKVYRHIKTSAENGFYSTSISINKDIYYKGQFDIFYKEFVKQLFRLGYGIDKICDTDFKVCVCIKWAEEVEK
jgi:hypothetical protein